MVEVDDGVTRGGKEKVQAIKRGAEMRADEGSAADC